MAEMKYRIDGVTDRYQRRMMLVWLDFALASAERGAATRKCLERFPDASLRTFSIYWIGMQDGVDDEREMRHLELRGRIRESHPKKKRAKR